MGQEFEIGSHKSMQEGLAGSLSGHHHVLLSQRT